MVRKSYADNRALNYLSSLVSPNICTVGLILGQTFDDYDYIVHLAKSPNTVIPNNVPANNISEIIEVNISDHAKHVTRMLPGGMHVLGIFVVSEQELLSPFNPKLKSLLQHLHKSLDSYSFIYGNSVGHEKIVLNYCSKTAQTSANVYNVFSTSITPVEFVFKNEPNIWIPLECKLEIDEFMVILRGESAEPIKTKIKTFLGRIQTSLSEALFLFNGDCTQADEKLASLTIPKVKKPKSIDTHHPYVQAVILFPTLNSPAEHDQCVIDVIGSMKMKGRLISKLWLNPNLTIRKVTDAIIQDILRSLAVRMDMHWDSLTEGEQGDGNIIHEPPRKVLVTLPYTRVTFCDYLFPGEGPQEALMSVRDILDIKVHLKDVEEIESQADIKEFTEDHRKSSFDELPKLGDPNKFMYSLGAIVAIAVLIISLIVHYFLRK